MTYYAWRDNMLNQVVSFECVHNDQIGIVTLEDRANNNTFSKGIIEGLDATFTKIKSNPSLKVIIITGYDTYFCCGGTQEELLAIAEHRISFNDLSFYRYLLDCSLPTIAAIQGHALGGGLVFGLYADIILLSEESFYSANFMKYGFTPGMGATYLLPQKLGLVLGEEMLYTAQNYQGRVLAARGAPLHIMKKELVLAEALEKAKILCEKPKTSLVLLKNHLTRTLKATLPEVIQHELKMHDVTFNLPEVKGLILNRF